jgi:hypothetical protein
VDKDVESEATEVRALRVTSVAVTTVDFEIETTEPRLTVVADIAVEAEIAVSPPRLTAPPEVIDSPLAEVTPLRLTAPVAVIETSPEKEAEPNEKSVEPSIVIVVVVWAATLLDTKVVAFGQLTVVGSTPEIFTEVASGNAKLFGVVLAAPSVNPEKSTDVTDTPAV